MARLSAPTALDSRRVSRRQFLGAAAGAGVTGVLAAGRAPAFAQTRELTFLTVASFVPETDKELKRQLDEWGAKNKVKVRLDIIAHLQLVTKKASEVQARSGHDLTAVGPGLGDADLYFDYLADLNDVATDVAPKNGGWLNPNDYLIRGKWKLLPWWMPPFPMAVRTDLLEQIGEKNPDTWEDWLRVGKKGKAIGHPFGTALGHSGDANVTLLSIMWSYGASYVAKDGKTVTGYWCVGIWNFAKNVDLAKDFLRSHFQPENQAKWVDAGHGFNMPFLTNLTKHPVYKSDKQYRFIPEVAKVTVPPSWPGPTTAASQQVWDLYIIPDMFAQHATGKMTADQAIAWAEKEMQEIYAGRKRKP